MREGEPPRSGRGSGIEVWREHARALGHEVPPDATRGEIIAMCDEGVRDETVDGWHPIVRDWYRSLGDSGQSDFYEPSDWLTARLLAEAMSRELNPQPMLVMSEDGPVAKMVTLPPKGASLAAWFKAMSSLLVTEGDRRRMQVELTRRDAEADDEAPAAEVTDLRSWRDALNS